jgi:hypothetical protein
MFKELISMPFYFAQANKQKKAAAKINPVRVDYQVSPYAKEMYGAANMALNGRMAGAAQQEANIQQGQANAIGATQRGATSAAQFLALANASQGLAGQQYGNLAAMEAQDYQRRLGNQVNAQGVMIGEGDKVYQDKMAKYMEESQTKAMLQQASIQNKFNGVNAIGGFMDSAAQMAISALTGGVGGLGGAMGGAKGGGGLTMQGASQFGPSVGSPNLYAPNRNTITPYGG